MRKVFGFGSVSNLLAVGLLSNSAHKAWA